MLYALSLSCSSGLERVLQAGIYRLERSESAACIFPLSLLRISSDAISGICLIVVGNYLISLHIPFSRHKHICTRILQHRYEIRDHETLGEHVLDGLEERRSLPYPFLGTIIIIASVALPHRYMSAFQTFAEIHAVQGTDNVPS